jgi:hypothetical protein
VWGTFLFAVLFLLTFGTFTITYMIIWSNLLIVQENGVEWAFLFSTWLGISFGGLLTYTFFKTVESLKIRGLLICTFLVPMIIYAQYLNWVKRENMQGESLQGFFMYVGAIVFGGIGGVCVGLLIAFQGVYMSAYAKSIFTLGTHFGFHWFLFGAVYFYLFLLNKLVISFDNKLQIGRSAPMLALSTRTTKLCSPRIITERQLRDQVQRGGQVQRRGGKGRLRRYRDHLVEGRGARQRQHQQCGDQQHDGKHLHARHAGRDPSSLRQ